MLPGKLKGYRFPIEIIEYCVWSYHRFNDSYRDVQERLAFRGLTISHETIRAWCLRFSRHYVDVIRKQERKPTDKWHLDEMVIKINGERYVLWRAVDSTGHELDILVQKHKSKKAAKRFFCKLLGNYPAPRVAITDKLPSYKKPIKYMCSKTEHRCHKRLNNRVENAHQATRRKEKCLIKFKSPKALQRTVSLMGKTRNLFAIAVGRYTNTAADQRQQFVLAKTLWQKASLQLLCA